MKTKELTLQRKNEIIRKHCETLDNEACFENWSKKELRQLKQEFADSADYTIIDYAEMYGY